MPCGALFFFKDNIVLIRELIEEINEKLELYIERQHLEAYGQYK